jgi:hypothetical protein
MKKFIEYTKQDVTEGAKVDRMVKYVKQSEKKLGHSDKEAENIAWATANKRGMLDNKQSTKEEVMSAAPTNAVGSGAIAGSGGAGGEPGVSKKRTPVMSFLKRKQPKM